MSRRVIQLPEFRPLVPNAVYKREHDIAYKGHTYSGLLVLDRYHYPDRELIVRYLIQVARGIDELSSEDNKSELEKILLRMNPSVRKKLGDADDAMIALIRDHAPALKAENPHYVRLNHGLVDARQIHPEVVDHEFYRGILTNDDLTASRWSLALPLDNNNLPKEKVLKVAYRNMDPAHTTQTRRLLTSIFSMPEQIALLPDTSSSILDKMALRTIVEIYESSQEVKDRIDICPRIPPPDMIAGAFSSN